MLAARRAKDPASIDTTVQSVRRVAIAKQHLAGPLPSKVTAKEILAVVRDLGYVQWDPVSIVAPSHNLALWARLGEYKLGDLDRLLWKEKKLFEHWTPIASLVLTEDYPIYASLMRGYPDSLSDSWGSQRDRARRFLREHAELRREVLTELRKGPLVLSEFRDHAATRRNRGEWSFGSDVSQMLFQLHMTGEIMVVGHRGAQNLWGLTWDFLPRGMDRRRLSPEEVERISAIRAIGALGTATPTEINHYYVRGRYRHLRQTLAKLHAESRILPVSIQGLDRREERYVLQEDLPILESGQTESWAPRMSLLPPFDNLICSEARTARLFGFRYVREQFLPAEKRKFGTYVLPILYGDQFIGRVDPRLDRDRGMLVVNAIHAEPGAPSGEAIGRRIRDTVERLGRFLGVSRVTYPSRTPREWNVAFG